MKMEVEAYFSSANYGQHSKQESCFLLPGLFQIFHDGIH